MTSNSDIILIQQICIKASVARKKESKGQNSSHSSQGGSRETTCAVKLSAFTE